MTDEPTPTKGAKRTYRVYDPEKLSEALITETEAANPDEAIREVLVERAERVKAGDTTVTPLTRATAIADSAHHTKGGKAKVTIEWD